MNKISMDKKYKTRNGEFEAKPLIINMNDGNYSVACLLTELKNGNQHIAKFSEYGGFYCSDDVSGFDLIEVSPYADIPIDAKVLVWNGKGDKIKRHFAGISDTGNPMAFDSGTTSFTSPCNPSTWCNCELYTGE